MMHYKVNATRQIGRGQFYLQCNYNTIHIPLKSNKEKYLLCTNIQERTKKNEEHISSVSLAMQQVVQTTITSLLPPVIIKEVWDICTSLHFHTEHS